MPRPYPPEFRQRAVALVRAGKQAKQAKQAKQIAYELGISAGCLHNRVRQDRIDRGELAGVTTTESAELRAARKRVRELETELAIIRQASKFLAEEKPHPKVAAAAAISRCSRSSSTSRCSRRPISACEPA